MALPDSYYRVPAERLMLSAMLESQVLTIEAKQASTAYALRAGLGFEVQPLLDISQRLHERFTRVMRWHVDRLAAINADMGAAEHNSRFREWFGARENYRDEMAEVAADAWLNRGRYLPNLTETLWGVQSRRERILNNLYIVFQNIPEGTAVHAFDLAGALEAMYASNVRQANWTRTRMFGLSPRERARSRVGLLPPGASGVSYEHLRVIRTEMAGLQQQMAYQRYDQQPWVVGYDWRLSPNHPETDICDSLAAESPYPIGSRVDIPHPNCLCFVTPRQMPDRDFDARVQGWLNDENSFLDNYEGFLGRDPTQRLPQSGALTTWHNGRNIPDSPQRLKGRYAAQTQRYAANVPITPLGRQMLAQAKGWN